MDLANREHGAFIATLSTFASVAEHGWVRRWPGLVAVVTGTAIPIFNALLIAAASVDDQDLEDARTALAASGVPWSLYVRKGSDEALAERLGAGEPTFTMPGMAMHPIPHHAPPDELVIRRVVDADGHAIHVRMVADVFEAPADEIRAFTPPGLVAAPGVDIFIGLVDDEPVATSLGVSADGVVTLFNVATVPEARRLGYGAAMTMAPALAARNRGVEVAALQSTEAGFPVYEQLGFRTVVEYEPRSFPAAG